MNINSKRKQKDLQATFRKAKLAQVARWAEQLAQRCFERQSLIPAPKSKQQKRIAVIAVKLLEGKTKEYNDKLSREKEQRKVADVEQPAERAVTL